MPVCFLPSKRAAVSGSELSPVCLGGRPSTSWDSGEAFLLDPVKYVSATKTTKPGGENWSEC